MSAQSEFERAQQTFRNGDLQSAASVCRSLLERDTEHAAAWHLLAEIAGRQGDIDAAIDHVKTALAVDEGFIEARYTLGELYVSAGEVAAAEAAYQVVIDGQPESAVPWIRLGDTMRAAGLSDEAISAYREATSRDTDSADAWAGLGSAFLDRGQPGDAMMALKRAVKKAPDHVEARNALAVALQRLGRAGEAIATLQDSIAIQPDAASTRHRLGDLLLAQGRWSEAADALRGALQLAPDLGAAQWSLGKAQEYAGELEQAAASYARVLELQPQHTGARLDLLLVRQRLCDWDGIDASARELGAQTEAAAMPPLAGVALGLAADKQLALATRFAASMHAKQAIPPSSVFTKRPITIAYLSGDFCDSPVGSLIVPVLENHDRSKFRVAAFSYGPDDRSETRRRVKGAVDEFVDIRFHSHEAAAREIRTRGVQILIDLAGYGRDARPQIVALRPAPVQIGYLGYRGTLGGHMNDYIVVDDYLLPESAQRHYSEQPLRMPRGVLVMDRPTVGAVPRDACDLPQDALVFCCFDDTRKISRGIFAVWMQLLRDVPGSVLWLEQRSPYPGQRLRSAAQAAGVDPDRLVFAPATDAASTIGRYAHADLCLDTYPCNAGATTAQALFGGCPVLTCSGDSYVSRTAGSVLRQVGMDRLICEDLDAYARTARELAAMPASLSELRKHIGQAMQTVPFADVRAFTADMEAAFEQALQAGARGEPPRPLRPDVA